MKELINYFKSHTYPNNKLPTTFWVSASIGYVGVSAFMVKFIFMRRFHKYINIPIKIALLCLHDTYSEPFIMTCGK